MCANTRQPADWLRRLASQITEVADRLDNEVVRREEIQELVAELRGIESEVFGPRPRARRGEGARRRILDYLSARVGQTVTGDELAEISGIQEWARRIRELRVEDGYEITELGGSRYRLESATPNTIRAARWQLLNQVRNSAGSARDRIGRLFEALVGEVVTREDIDNVAGIAEGIRRLRELRDEAGWPIDSHIDDLTLRPGEYRLLSTDPSDRRDALQRLYPEQLRARVFERDSYTCQVCGRDRASAAAAGDTRFYLEVHHRVAIADELEALPREQRNDINNLVTLCHRDHVAETAALQARRRRERPR
jgi:hypothetical protein